MDDKKPVDISDLIADHGDSELVDVMALLEEPALANLSELVGVPQAGQLSVEFEGLSQNAAAYAADPMPTLGLMNPLSIIFDESAGNTGTT